MSSVNKYNFIQIIENSLLAELKPEITKRITSKIIKEIEKDIRPIIKAEVDKLIINGVEQIKDLASMRDEIKVYMEWKNENNN